MIISNNKKWKKKKQTEGAMPNGTCNKPDTNDDTHTQRVEGYTQPNTAL